MLSWKESNVPSLQDPKKNPTFFLSFHVISSVLDNIEARQWRNATVYSWVQVDQNGDPGLMMIIPIIDGGTEGSWGPIRVIF